jgi:DNA-binding response OmpR family regulator
MKLAFWKTNTESSEEPVATTATFPQSPSRSAIRVLMVDDEESFTQMAKRNLEATGQFEVETCSRAMKAVDAAKSFRPQIILLDVMMPDGDGGDVAAKLAADTLLADIPVMFLTAAIKSSEIGRTGAGQIGGRFYIAKPVKLEYLVELIQQRANAGAA